MLFEVCRLKKKSISATEKMQGSPALLLGSIAAYMHTCIKKLQNWPFRPPGDQISQWIESGDMAIFHFFEEFYNFAESLTYL